MELLIVFRQEQIVEMSRQQAVHAKKFLDAIDSKTHTPTIEIRLLLNYVNENTSDTAEIFSRR